VDQVVIAAMRVDNNDLLQPGWGNFTANIFQRRWSIPAGTDATWHVARFQDLGVDKIRENHTGSSSAARLHSSWPMYISVPSGI